VSGEAFTVAADSERVVHEGRTYVFCCAGCKDEFLADPAKFAAK
jgi:YHS domain-containing protein